MNRCRMLSLQFALLCFLFSGKTFADEMRPVFLIMQQEPYSYLDADGKSAGYVFQIANRILKEAGFPQKAQMLPIKRMIRDISSGTADCTIAASSPFARKTFSQIEPIGHPLQVGIVPRKGITLRTYADLEGLRIGVPRGMSIGDPFDSDTNLTKVPTPDYEKSALMLAYGRIDAIMGAVESIRFSALKKAGLVGEIFGDPLVTQTYPNMLMCNKDLPEDGYVLSLKQATRRLKARGEIQEIIRDFFSFEVSNRTLFE